MITTTGVQAGSYTAADITVNEAGQITSAASNSVVVSGGGGGPKISGVVVTDNAWTALDDTAVDVLGGYIKITGSGFSSGCLVYFNQTPASSVSFISSTELRVTTGALSAGTYVVYAINTDGGVAISVPGVTFSASPSWQTASTLSDQYDGVAISLGLVATEATSYTLVSGSLPPGLSLNASTGAITGTVVGVTVDTTYTFTVRATDAQNQDSPRTFTVTITVSDPYFKSTTLLLSGSALTTNTALRDSSTNNFNLTAYGDARASNFTPYGTGWSLYTNDRSYLTIPASSDFDVINTDFTIEFWINFEAFSTMASSGNNIAGPGLSNYASSWFVNFGGSGTTVTTLNYTVMTSLSVGTSNSFTVSLNFNTWYHVAFVRSGSGPGNFKLYINGIQQGAAQNQVTYSGAGSTMAIGSGSFIQNSTYSGNSSYFLSNFRLTKSAVYLENFTPATTPLTALENTTLLLFNQSRLINAGTNTGTITSSGYTSTRAKLISFNPFGITNTGTSGSAYFDGTGDYLSAASNTALNLTGDYTVECWFYANSFPTQPALFGIGSDAAGLVLTIVSSKVYAYFVGVGNVFGSGGTTLITNSWNHIAIVRSGTTNTCYINGSQSGTTYSSSATISSTGGVGIGRTLTGTAFNDWNGYVADFRIVKGTAVYTSNFTPPTQPLTAVANTQLLTLQYDQPHNNHTFLDASSNQHLITRSGNATQGSFSPFSPAGWSNYFGGSPSYLSGSGQLLGVGSNDFTVEAWVFIPSLSASGSHIILGTSTTSSSPTGIYFQVMSTGTLWAAETWGINLYSTTGLTFTAGTWNHVALCRSGNTARIFLNGVQASNTGSFSQGYNSTSFVIGRTWTTDAGSSAYMVGYISDLRVISGQALYSGDFTPPAASLTATQVGSTGAGAAASITGTVTLLTCQNNQFKDNSPSSRAITGNGPSVQAFSPFAPTAVYNPVTHGGSGYLDGSGDYFILTNESAYDFGDGNFSIDFWYYPLSAQGYGGIYMRDGQDQPLGIYSGTSMTPAWPECVMNVGTTTTWFATNINTSGVQKYAWNHIAFTRVGNTFRAFTNGVLSSVVTASGTMGSGGTPWIGKNGTAAGLSELSMYLSGFRMTKGGIPTLFSTSSTTTGTTIFAVPTQPFTANDSLTGGSLSILANFADAAVIDSSGRQILETVGNAQISTTQSKFDGSSIYLDGNGGYLYSPPNQLNVLGTADFTIEMWAYVTDYTTASPTYNDYGTFIDYRTANVSQVNVLLGFLSNIGGLGRPVMYVNGAVTITGNVITTNTWTHIALCRASGVTRLFMNGNQAGSNYTDTNNYVSNLFTIGTNINRTDAFLKGYIQDPRITRGYARYTSNFTPPAVSHRLK
jgi:hypothetical protein